MKLSKDVSNKTRKVNQCKVNIAHKPSPSNHARLFKALSMLLNKEDILDCFDRQKNLRRNAKKPSKKKGNNDFHYPPFMSASSTIDKYPPKALPLNNEGAK